MAIELGMDLTKEKRKEFFNSVSWTKRVRKLSNTMISSNNKGENVMTYSLIRQFNVGDWELLFISIFKDFKGKFNTYWIGPYEIKSIFNNGSVKIHTIDDENVSFLVNGHKIKLYKNPKSKG